MMVSMLMLLLASVSLRGLAAPSGLRHSKPHVHRSAMNAHVLTAVKACEHEPCPNVSHTKATTAAHHKKSKKSKVTQMNHLETARPWSYADIKQWQKDFSACGKPGQSPIALTTDCESGPVSSLGLPKCKGGDTLNKHASYTVVAGCYLKNTGKIMEVEGTGYFGKFNVGKYQWKAKQLQFHLPSEHTLNGRRFDAEMQIVHIHPTAPPLIVSIFIMEGSAHHDWLSSLGFDMLNMPREAG